MEHLTVYLLRDQGNAPVAVCIADSLTKAAELFACKRNVFGDSIQSVGRAIENLCFDFSFWGQD